MIKKIKNILIIAPHADDEVLGCGGLISKYKNLNFTVLICTNANLGAPELFSESYIKKIKEETLKSHKFLKIKKTLYLNLPAPKLDQYPVFKISNMIKDVILKNNFDTVFFPSNSDLHVDHKIISHCSIVATRPLAKKNKVNLISYETLSETEWGVLEKGICFVPNFFVSLSKTNLKDKIKSFRFFKSQNKSNIHPRSVDGIRSLAEQRGKFVGEKYAESYKIIRLLD